jgi:hypothetical protein
MIRVRYNPPTRNSKIVRIWPSLSVAAKSMWSLGVRTFEVIDDDGRAKERYDRCDIHGYFQSGTHDDDCRKIGIIR